MEIDMLALEARNYGLTIMHFSEGDEWKRIYKDASLAVCPTPLSLSQATRDTASGQATRSSAIAG